MSMAHENETSDSPLPSHFPLGAYGNLAQAARTTAALSSVVPQMSFLGFVDLSVRSVDAKAGWNMNRATYGTTHAWETTTVSPEFHVFNLKNGKHGQAVQCSGLGLRCGLIPVGS